MNLNKRKEQFSVAWIHAVAAACGCNILSFAVDEDSIDVGLAVTTTAGPVRSPRLDVQLKCSAVLNLNDQFFTFDLRVKNYDELRDAQYSVPKILVVLRVPTDVSEWLEQMSEEEMISRYCAYWRSLRGEPEVQNANTVAVRIERANVFDPHALVAMMDRLQQGGMP